MSEQSFVAIFLTLYSTLVAVLGWIAITLHQISQRLARLEQWYERESVRWQSER